MKIVNTLSRMNNYSIIPFRVVGIYSLYICLKFAAEYLKVDKAINFFVRWLDY